MGKEQRVGAFVYFGHMFSFLYSGSDNVERKKKKKKKEKHDQSATMNTSQESIGKSSVMLGFIFSI